MITHELEVGHNKTANRKLPNIACHFARLNYGVDLFRYISNIYTHTSGTVENGRILIALKKPIWCRHEDIDYVHSSPSVI